MIKSMYADIHTHSTVMPFGRSYPDFIQAPNPTALSNIWRVRPPSLYDIISRSMLTPYTQTDFKSLFLGNVRLVCVSLYPIESGWVRANERGRLRSEREVNLKTNLGLKMIRHLQKMKNNNDIYKLLKDEYNFLLSGNNKPVTIKGTTMNYKVVNTGREMQNILENPDSNTIAVVITVEGAQSFGSGIDLGKTPAEPKNVISNINDFKQICRPFFVTLSHHFFNELCGHAKSFLGLGARLLDQTFGFDSPITKLGHEVIETLLDNSDDKRVLIDIKHLSQKCRDEFFARYDGYYTANNIPYIVSHGAARGKSESGNLFHDGTINFTDDEIIRVAKSNGIFGIMFDRHRLMNQEIKTERTLDFWSGRIWQHAGYIADLLDGEYENAWDIQSIGTDFDGCINPIKYFQTAQKFPLLEQYLLKHAKKYLHKKHQWLRKSNKMDAEEIVQKIMFGNAYNFILNNY